MLPLWPQGRGENATLALNHQQRTSLWIGFSTQYETRSLTLGLLLWSLLSSGLLRFHFHPFRLEISEYAASDPLLIHQHNSCGKNSVGCSVTCWHLLKHWDSWILSSLQGNQSRSSVISAEKHYASKSRVTGDFINIDLQIFYTLMVHVSALRKAPSTLLVLSQNQMSQDSGFNIETNKDLDRQPRSSSFINN